VIKRDIKYIIAASQSQKNIENVILNENAILGKLHKLATFFGIEFSSIRTVL
jgi:hypothetical protein